MWLITWLKRRTLRFGEASSSEGKKRRRLSALLADLAQHGPAWYRPFSNRLSPEFGPLLLELRQAARTLNAVYHVTLAGTPGQYQAATGYLIEEALAGSHLELDSFSFDRIRKDSAGQTGDPRPAMDKLFARRISAFKAPDFERVKSGCDANLRLVSVCHFKFEILVEALSRRLERERLFRASDAALVVEQLEDWLFLIEGLRADGAMRETFVSLARLSATVDLEEAEAAFTHLFELITGFQDTNALRRVVQAIRSDPAYQTKTWTESSDIVQECLQSLADEYHRNRREYDTRIMAADLAAKKRALFGEKDLIEAGGYSTETSRILEEHGLPGFPQAQALTVIRSFLAFHYESRIFPALGAVIIECNFNSPGSRGRFNDPLDLCGQLAWSVAKFEETVALDRPGRLPELLRILREAFLDHAGKLKARRYIEEINSQADAVVRNCFSAYQAMHDAVIILLDDFRSGKSELISNGAFVQQRLPAMVEDLAEGDALMTDCLDLLGKMSVNLNPARRALS